MQWLKRIGFLCLFLSMVAGCGKDEKREQDFQKTLKEKTQKERTFYEKGQKNIEDLEKSVQGQQQGVKK